MSAPDPISLVASDGFVPVGDFVPPEAIAGSAKPGMSVTEALTMMEEAKAGPESVELMSKSMDTPKLMKWGVESGKMAGDKLPPADAEALAQAEEILGKCEAMSGAAGGEGAGAAGIEEAGAAASEAAAAGGFAGPGSFMAQAVAFAASAGSLGASGGAATPLTASTVAGSVMLSAAALNDQLPPPTDPDSLQTIEDPEGIKKAEEEAAELAKAEQAPPAESYEKLKPFIDLGKKIAAG